VTGSHLVGIQAPAATQQRAISFFLQNNSLLITQRAWNEMLEFILWTARKWPEHRLLVREHPVVPLTAEEKQKLAQASNVELCPAVAMSLDGILRQTGIAVAFYSTTLVEALAHEGVPLIINITGMPHYSPDLAGLGAGIEVHDFDAARQAMQRLLTGEDLCFRDQIRAISRDFFAYSTDAALRKIVAAIAPSHRLRRYLRWSN
jgi:hypothetical protein